MVVWLHCDIINSILINSAVSVGIDSTLENIISNYRLIAIFLLEISL